MHKTHKKNKGFIAILSLLIISTISMIIAITILRDGVDNASLSLFSIYYENARINTISCVEDTFVRIKLEAEFNQNISYDFGENQSCSTDISWSVPQIINPQLTETLVSLNVTGKSNNFTRNFNYALKVKKYQVNNADSSIQYTNTINIISVTEV